eukprot:6208806-Pleurochrysis_carterae.AAC.2
MSDLAKQKLAVPKCADEEALRGQPTLPDGCDVQSASGKTLLCQLWDAGALHPTLGMSASNVFGDALDASESPLLFVSCFTYARPCLFAQYGVEAAIADVCCRGLKFVQSHEAAALSGLSCICQDCMTQFTVTLLLTCAFYMLLSSYAFLRPQADAALQQALQKADEMVGTRFRTAFVIRCACTFGLRTTAVYALAANASDKAERVMYDVKNQSS